MIYLFLADGFEECEALAPLDILRRAQIEVLTVGVTGKTVKGAHGVEIIADIQENEVILDNTLQGIILPGGMPGTVNLEKSKTVQKAIDYAADNKLLISAICAAPSILGHKGLLKNIKATCFTGFEKDLTGAFVCDCPVVCDGIFITAISAGAAFDFGYEILSYLTDRKTADKLKKQMHFTE